jgi:hypothetical protein
MSPLQTRKDALKQLQTDLGFSLKCPINKENFAYYWDMYIFDVASRENFKQSHLLQLKTLCELHLDEDRLKEAVDTKGFSFIAYSKNGEEAERPLPEVVLLMRVRSQIKEYLKMMGLLLQKDKITNHKKEANEFI